MKPKNDYPPLAEILARAVHDLAGALAGDARSERPAPHGLVNTGEKQYIDAIRDPTMRVVDQTLNPGYRKAELDEAGLGPKQRNLPAAAQTKNATAGKGRGERPAPRHRAKASTKKVKAAGKVDVAKTAAEFHRALRFNQGRHDS